ncbi:MAG: hypothetical protein IT244_03805 [Bacteroidia bacterium]|nr:hypothetical protein [Bacteroidia bacterium]
MRSIFKFYLVLSTFISISLNAQDSLQWAQDIKRNRSWDSLKTINFTVQSGFGLFGPNVDPSVLNAGNFNYSFDNPESKIIPSWKSTKSITLGFTAEFNLPKNPVTPRFSVVGQHGFMKIFFTDTASDSLLFSSKIKNINQIYIAPGIGFHFKYFTLGLNLVVGAMWGGQKIENALPYEPFVLKNNKLNWDSHFLIGPEYFFGFHYKRIGIQYSMVATFNPKINFAPDSHVPIFSNRLVFTYHLFSSKYQN